MTVTGLNAIAPGVALAIRQSVKGRMHDSETSARSMSDAAMSNPQPLVDPGWPRRQTPPAHKALLAAMVTRTLVRS